MVAEFILVLAMKIAILEYESEQGKPKRLKVRPGQSVLIGASNSSDLRLPDRDQVAAQHCEVTFASGTLAIKNLTSGKQAVRVNGAPVNRQRLNNGDQLEIGNNRLKVVLQNQPDRSAPVESVAVTAAAGAGAASVAAGAAKADANVEQQPTDSFPAKTKTNAPVSTAKPEPTDEEDPLPRLELAANGLRIGFVDSVENGILSLVNPETAASQFGLLVNHKVSQLSQPVPDADNLVADLAPEVVSCNDLYWLQYDEVAPLLKSQSQYAEQHAATMLFSRSPGGLCEDDIKLVAAWFLTPGGIKFHLVNGTDLLLEKVFSIVDAVIVQDQETGHVMIMSLDPTVTNWNLFEQWIKEEPQ